MIKEKYKQLCLALRFGGINTIEHTLTLDAIPMQASTRRLENSENIQK